MLTRVKSHVGPLTSEQCRSSSGVSRELFPHCENVCGRHRLETQKWEIFIRAGRLPTATLVLLLLTVDVEIYIHPGPFKADPDLMSAIPPGLAAASCWRIIFFLE